MDLYTRNFTEAKNDTKGFNQEQIIAYCKNRLSKTSYSDSSVYRWEWIRDRLLDDYKRLQSCQYKIGDKIHHIKCLSLNREEVDYARTDIVTNVTLDLFGDIKLETEEIVIGDTKPRHGLVSPRWIELA